MTTDGSLAVLVVVLLAGPALLTSGATGHPAPDGTPLAGAGSTERLVSASVQENNSTRHVNPDRAGERGNLEDVELWLAARMGDRIERSSVQLSQGEYEEARSLVGEDYRQLLGKYVDVTGETGERDDGSVDRFAQARETQDELVSQVQEYQETREEYREAKENGDEERARELARDLQRQADEIDDTSRQLERQYDTITNSTAVNLTGSSQAVGTVRSDVSEQQAAIRTEAFVETRLSLSTDAETISFTEPLEATGRLVAANGSPLSNRSVRFHVGAQNVTTTTDAEGRFVLTYRPTTVPVGEQSLPVRYVPANASKYLGADVNVSVTVEQVQPRIDLARQFDTLAFDDELVVNGSVTVVDVVNGSVTADDVVNGSVTVDDVGAAAVPVVVTLGDEQLGNTTTGPNGSFTVEGTVPATVEAGERNLSVRVPLAERALTDVTTNASVQVASTETRLVLAESAFESGELRLSGTLETLTGRPVPNSSVAVILDGTRVGTGRTGTNGTFSARLDVPPRLRPASAGEPVQLVVAFYSGGTNLETARATDSIQGPSSGASAGTGGFAWIQLSLSKLAVRGAIAVLLVLGVAGVELRRDPGPVERSHQKPVDTDQPTGTVRLVPDQSVVDLATRRLEEGATDAAVEVAYAAVRREVASAFDVAGTRTHWEFLQASCDAGLPDDESSAVADLTERYEWAAFAPGSVPDEDAEVAVDTARSFSSSVARSK